MNFLSTTRTALVGALTALPLLATASACLYRGDDASARVINRSGEITTPFPEARSASDCRRLRVASGLVRVYILGGDRSAITSREVGMDGGPLVPATASSSGEPGLLRQIAVVLEGLQRTKTGSSRSGEADFLLAALPSNHLAEPTSDLRIVLGPVPDANLSSFELLVDGKSVHRQQGPSAEVLLPAARLKPGAQAVWRLAYAGQRHEGKFNVEPLQAIEPFKSALAQQPTASADAVAARLQVAAELEQAGFSWDARELLREAVQQRN